MINEKSVHLSINVLVCNADFVENIMLIQMSDKMQLSVVAAIVMGVASAGVGIAFWQPNQADAVTNAANQWIETLDPDQRAQALRPFQDETRTDWHFIPKNDRKGVQLRDMTQTQKDAAFKCLQSVLSSVGYTKATEIMHLEEILRRLEGEQARNVRDDQRYFFTIFGMPDEAGSWGISIEGHHLSLNVTIRDNQVVDSTPQFFGANPATVHTSSAGLPPVGHRVLRDEESLAFQLVQSLNTSQQEQAIIAKEAPREIRAAGEPQPGNEPMEGIAYSELDLKQQSLLRRLVETYCQIMPDPVAEARLQACKPWDAVRFAWAGSLEPGVGHGYRVEGTNFLIELVNVQPDPEGNPANHIHCIWRDKTGDFDLPNAG